MEFLFEYLVSNAILAAGLALLVAGVTRLWRNPQLAHALWIVVLLKLVSPPLLPVPVCTLLAPARQRPLLNHGDIRQQLMRAPDLAAGTDIGLKPLASSEVLEDPNDGLGDLAAWETITDAGTPETPLSLEERPEPARSWLPLVAALWLSGTLLRLILVSRRVIRFHRVACGMAPAVRASLSRPPVLPSNSSLGDVRTFGSSRAAFRRWSGRPAGGPYCCCPSSCYRGWMITNGRR